MRTGPTSSWWPPATVHCIAKLAHGMADDALTTTILHPPLPWSLRLQWTATCTTTRPPRKTSISCESAEHSSSGRRPVDWPPAFPGWGRLVDTAEIVDSLYGIMGRNGDLAGKHIVVSAGGTQEPIDPVRVITNYSSGKMGYALAQAARDRGAKVTLVTAPTALPSPAGVEMRRVVTVADMREAVLSACVGADALIMAAAVSDYRPAQIADQKIKKVSDSEGMTLNLVKNNDFFLEVPKGVLRIGFAAESEDLLSNARVKLEGKDMALIAANDITAPDSGFNVDTNKVILLDREGGVDELPLMSKYDVGHSILDRVATLLSAAPVP